MLIMRNALSCRAELGRATWKYFHTVMARFPEKPTEDQQEALRSYILLFARLYPWYDMHYPLFSVFEFPLRPGSACFTMYK